MADDEEEDEGPAVELGDGEPVEGAPVARVASRLTWPIERSEIERKEGDVEIRTPEGPRTVSSVLVETDVTYFERRGEFVEAVREAVGVGPITTE